MKNKSSIDKFNMVKFNVVKSSNMYDRKQAQLLIYKNISLQSILFYNTQGIASDESLPGVLLVVGAVRASLSCGAPSMASDE